MAGTLFVVATPIGNLEDITVRALRVLREVALIAAEDTRRTGHLLARYAIATRTTSLHAHNERTKARQLLERLESGESIALVSDAGTPTISDPGGHLIETAIARGIRVEPVPGPNAAIAALSVAGVTAESFTFLGFPPIRSKDRSMWFERARGSAPVVVFYEAPHRIRRTLEDFLAEFGDIHVVIARELTKLHEELVRGPISVVSGMLSQDLGEFTVVAMVGQKTELDRLHSDPAALSPGEASPDTAIAAMFGEMTNVGGLTRREAVSLVAKRHGISQREAYMAIERAKISVG